MSFEIGRKQYASMYGPTTGDSIRLADTELFIRIEKDYTTYGEECKFGGGKSLRAGMGLNPVEMRDNEKVVDTIITNAVILDYTGVYKADIGIKDGGKSLRAGMGLNPVEMRDNEKVVDTIITNAVILDYTGVYKADIGIKDGKIKFIGKGGNPDMMDNVDFIVSASTEVIAGE